MKISVVSFDLTNTLLRVKPSIGAICVEAMRAQKIAEIPEAKEFDARVSAARKTALANKNSPTSETLSRKYWQAMLWEIFAGRCSNAQFAAATEFVYKSLAEPEHWALMPHVEAVLEALKFLGLRLVVLSNGDSRWEKALADKNILQFFDGIFLSAKTGLAKPDPAAFDNLCMSMKIERGELLHVGDSMAADVVPAKKFGAQVAWLHALSPGEIPPDKIPTIASLAELPGRVRANLVEKFATTKPSRSVGNMLAALSGIPCDDMSPRKYRELDREKEIKIKTKFIKASEERRERGDTEPREAAPLFKKVLISHGFFANSLQSIIQQHWAEIVPSKLADSCSPSALENSMSTLRIFCANPIVRQELDFQKSNILKKIAKFTGSDKVKKIIYEIG